MTDAEILEKLLTKHFDELGVRAREAFSDMQGRPLSDKQRRWVYGVAESFGICVETSANLFSGMSAGRRKQDLQQVRTRFPWETGVQKRPLKPPGR